MPYCSECGHPIEATCRFCPECGSQNLNSKVPSKKVPKEDACATCLALFTSLILEEPFCGNCGTKRINMLIEDKEEDSSMIVIEKEEEPINRKTVRYAIEPLEQPLAGNVTKARQIHHGQEVPDDDESYDDETIEILDLVCRQPSVSSDLGAKVSHTFEELQSSVSSDARGGCRVEGKVDETMSCTLLKKNDDHHSILQPKDPQWHEILQTHERQSSQFTDPEFPPTLTSILGTHSHPKLARVVTQWRRLSEMFHHTAYVELVLSRGIGHHGHHDDDDDRWLLSRVKQVHSKAAYDHCTSEPKPEEEARALEILTAALWNRKTDFYLACTRPLIEHFTETTLDLMTTRFQEFFEQKLFKHSLDSNALTFDHYGRVKSWNPKTTTGTVDYTSVHVMVPIIFDHKDVMHSEIMNNNNDKNNSSCLDLEQGALADRYLLGAIGIWRMNHSNVSCFPVCPVTGQSQTINAAGVYAVNFVCRGQVITVTVDDWIPCEVTGRPCFGTSRSSSSPDNLWIIVLLIEKALAKFHQSYAALEGGQVGEVLAALTGGISTRHEVLVDTKEEEIIRDQKERTTTTTWQDMKSSLARGSIVCGTTRDHLPNHRDDKNSMIRSNHPYGILLLLEFKFKSEDKHEASSRRVVQVGHVWHDDRQQQSPSSLEPAWMSRLSRRQMQQLSDYPTPTTSGKTSWMEYSEFTQIFRSWTESRDVFSETSSWASVHRVYGSWSPANAQGRKVLHQFPHYQLSICHQPTMIDTKVLIVLEQESKRRQKGDIITGIAPVVLKRGSRDDDWVVLEKGVVYQPSQFSTLELNVQCSGQEQTILTIVPATYDALKVHDIPYQVQILTSSRSTITDSKVLTLQSSSNSPRTKPKSCVHCHARIKSGEKFMTMGKKEEEEEGPVYCHADCLVEYRASRAPTCFVCALAIVSGQFYTTSSPKKTIHAECMARYRRESAIQCAYCQQAILKGVGEFSGKSIPVPDQQSIHAECWLDYQRSIAEKCVFCSQALLKIEGEFQDGRCYAVKGGKVHFECWQAYQATLSTR